MKVPRRRSFGCIATTCIFLALDSRGIVRYHFFLGGLREVPRLDFVLGHDLDLDAPPPEDPRRRDIVAQPLTISSYQHRYRIVSSSHKSSYPSAWRNCRRGARRGALILLPHQSPTLAMAMPAGGTGNHPLGVASFVPSLVGQIGSSGLAHRPSARRVVPPNIDRVPAVISRQPSQR